MITPSTRTAENIFAWIWLIAVILLILSIPWMVELAFHKEQPGPESGELIPVDSSIVHSDTLYLSPSWLGSESTLGMRFIFKNNTPKTVKIKEIKITSTQGK